MRQTASLPLGFETDAVFAYAAGRPVTAAVFRATAREIIARTSDAPQINLCEDRYAFLAGFAAQASRGQPTLLPSSRAPAVLVDLASQYPGCGQLSGVGPPPGGAGTDRALAPPSRDFVAAIGHTSGSTGKPTAHAKLWDSFHATTALNSETIRRALGNLPDRRRPWIVATVPPQHMYGLETSVLLPLLGGFCIHGGRPLLPADVAAALREVPTPRVLVSTPAHLRTLADSSVDFPSTAVIVSATAPLRQDVALAAERRFGAVLVELFGSTETCVIASRRTAAGECWRPYPGVQLEPCADSTLVRAPWFAETQRLQDIIELRPDNSFVVTGRNADLLEVAGKRASLTDLTQRLLGLPGVLDAIVFQPPAVDDRPRRCAALVVAPGLTAGEITRRLAPQVDRAFLPRPLIMMVSLPRNEVGKIPMGRLLEMLGKQGRR